MAKLALFSTYSVWDSNESFSAASHMVKMTGKDNPIIGNINTYSRNPNVKTTRFMNKLYFSASSSHMKENVKELMNCDIIFLDGGNTFEISNALQRYGVYKILKAFSKKGGVIAGQSAGAIMCTPTILSAMWADANTVEDEIPSYNGLNLVNFCLKPHSQSYLPRYTDEFQRFCDITQREFKCIPDGGAIIVEGDHMYEYGGVTTLTPVKV